MKSSRPKKTNAKTSATSKPRRAAVASSGTGWGLSLFLATTAFGAMMAMALWSIGATYEYGDAEAHLNIARRLFDSRTPGVLQVGTVWLPLLHLMLAPFAAVDWLWSNGLAGAIPGPLCYAIAVTMMYLAAKRAFPTVESQVPALTAALLFAVNPNLIYLSSLPMTEPLMMAALLALLYTTLRYRGTPTWGNLFAIAAVSNLASLTRYEGWFLIPFVAFYIWIAGKGKHAAAFALLASLAPLAWLAYNQTHFGDALAFYRGPYSARAIVDRQVAKGMVQPGDGNWTQAGRYYAAAVRHITGTPLLWVAAAGTLAALLRRAFWPLALLALPGAFYVWSIHTGGTPVFVPEYTPYTRYNIRYALVLWPLAAFAAAAVTALVPGRVRWLGSIAVFAAFLAGLFPLSLPICWEEAYDYGHPRVDRTQQASDYLRENYRRGAGIVFPFGDGAGVLREAGIPLREGIFQDNQPDWDRALADPAVFQQQEWALALAGDEVDQAVHSQGDTYKLVQQFTSGTETLEIFRRTPARTGHP